jgi:hypothetical protein
MRTLYFQPFSGASGDMILGALVDLGLPASSLEEGLSALGLPGWRLEVRREMRGPIEGTRLRVILGSGAILPEPPSHHGHRHGSGHGDLHQPPHSHEHEHSHEPHPSHEESKPRAAHTPDHHRHLADILSILEKSKLPEAVTTPAGSVFRRLAEAEARIHGVPVEAVHFHEVGAVDSIVDIVGVCLGIHLLGVEEVWSAPLTVGTGLANMAHGRLPLPAPATLELLRGFPVEQRESGCELTTPTGAALLTTLAGSFGTFPPMTVSAVGYGAGDDRPGPVPNLLRAILGERTVPPFPADRVVVLESNIDDMSPQLLGNLMERLFDAGALDVSVAPILMKKSRPAHEVKVIVAPDSEGRVLTRLFQESTTFGVRRMEVDRAILARESKTVDTPWGAIRVKVGSRGGVVLTASPEHEDLKEAAARSGIPLRDLHARVMEVYRRGS